MTEPNSRMINLDMEINEIKEEEKAQVVEEKKKPEMKEKEIFMNEKEIETQKKQRLKDHLAKCRAKSAEVRRKKKEEKLANKKPRGRPRKKKEPVVEQTEPQQEPQQEPQTEPQPVAEPPKQIEPLPPLVEEEVAEEEELNDPMDMLYTLFDEERIADKVVEKINKAKEARKAKEANMRPPPQPQYTAPQYSQQHITLFEEKIREDERKKMTAQLKQQKIQKLQNASNKYFDALPPVSLGNDNAWDNLFKPR